MKSTKLLLATAMMLPSALLAGCAHTVISNDVPPCEKLIPDEWRKGVPPADLPENAKLADGHDDARPWQKGFVEQTGQLEKSNGRTIDVDHIYATCLKMHRDALKKSNRGFFGRIFG